MWVEIKQYGNVRHNSVQTTRIKERHQFRIHAARRTLDKRAVLSKKRSDNTASPASSADLIKRITLSRRAAVINRASVKASQRFPAPVTSNRLISSAPIVPPGSRVRLTLRGQFCSSQFLSNKIWLDFPHPSPPSNEITAPYSLPTRFAFHAEN